MWEVPKNFLCYTFLAFSMHSHCHLSSEYQLYSLCCSLSTNHISSNADVSTAGLQSSSGADMRTTAYHVSCPRSIAASSVAFQYYDMQYSILVQSQICHAPFDHTQSSLGTELDYSVLCPSRPRCDYATDNKLQLPSLIPVLQAGLRLGNEASSNPLIYQSTNSKQP